MNEVVVTDRGGRRSGGERGWGVGWFHTLHWMVGTLSPLPREVPQWTVSALGRLVGYHVLRVGLWCDAPLPITHLFCHLRLVRLALLRPLSRSPFLHCGDLMATSILCTFIFQVFRYLFIYVFRPSLLCCRVDLRSKTYNLFASARQG